MADANVENSITVTVVSNGIGAVAGAIASQIAVVNAASPTISGGLAVAKMSIVSVAAETLGVVIAVQSGDADRIGREHQGSGLTFQHLENTGAGLNS